MDFARRPLALQRVWRRLVSFFDGGPLSPRRIAAFGFVSAFQKRAACRWLRQIEECVRRLLMLEALRLDPPPAPAPRARTQTTRKPTLSFCCEHALDPAEWRVRFRVKPPAPRKRKRGRSRFYIRWTIDGYRYRRRKRRDFYPALPLARRAEAVWRAVRDRHAYAQRLALRLTLRAGRDGLRAMRAALPAPARLDRGGVRKTGALLYAVHKHFTAALDRALRRHALAGWDTG